ncbi:heterokaryon incompatibility protein-domain-containing protein [Nemania sp. NC0429]|nr:heterokaryon incompatibility protein-domain-containing protein [Nemania sp. NC0429]
MHNEGKPENEYPCLPVHEPGTIRLLRLMPHKDRVAPIECQLFKYPLLELEHVSHLYEALSYVWGSLDECYSISLNGSELSVTENLHTALAELRDRYIERIMWIDAICINQGNDTEKEEQIRLMPEIYRKASRVVVWLGPAVDGGDHALEAIRSAADDASTMPSITDPITQHPIHLLLRRPWFERIWVLQEVAAAQTILVKCGSAAINGHVFSKGLTSKNLDPIYSASPDLQNLLRPVAYLMRRTGLRQTKSPNWLGRISLGIRPIGELIEMYHSRKATILHDKVFALLGMSSDSLERDIPVNYKIEWEAVLRKLVEVLLGKEVSIRTWPGQEIAEIQGKGAVAGKVLSVDNGHQDEQQVTVTLKTSAGCLGSQQNWTLPPSAKSVQVGDIICLLQGATNPTIARPCRDYLSIIMIVAPTLNLTRPITDYPLDFLLVWDWEKRPVEVQDEEDDETIERPLARCLKEHTRERPESGVRQWNVISILEDGEKYDQATERLEKMMKMLECESGRGDQCRLAVTNRLALVYAKTTRWEQARWLLNQYVRCVPGAFRPDITIRFEICLASIIEKQDHMHPWKFQVIRDILRADNAAGSLQKRAVEVAGTLDEEVIGLLLSRYGGEVEITEDMVAAAAGNGLRGEKVLQLLLSERGAEVNITEKVVAAAAGNQWRGGEVVRVLVDQRAGEIRITKKVIAAARENRLQGEKIMKLLSAQVEMGRIAREAALLLIPGQRSPTKKASTSHRRGHTALVTLPTPTQNWELVYGKPIINLVVVHGLGGDPLESWRSEPSGIPWFTEFLLPRIPQTRIMTFAYNSDILSLESSGIRDLARSLLFDLSDIREDDDGNSLIVFMGHGLGGLIIKQALLFATSEYYPDIQQCTKLTIFFSTPHHGMDIGEQMTLALRIPQDVSEHRRRIWDTMEQHSTELHNLSGDFRFIANNLDIITVAESRPLPGRNNLVVYKDSAVLRLPNEEVLEADADYLSMCNKTGNAYTSTYSGDLTLVGIL